MLNIFTPIILTLVFFLAITCMKKDEKKTGQPEKNEMSVSQQSTPLTDMGQSTSSRVSGTGPNHVSGSGQGSKHVSGAPQFPRIQISGGPPPGHFSGG